MKPTIELILERIDQGAALASREGTITYANERLAAMAGGPRRALLGMPLARLVRREGEQRLANLQRPFSSLRVRVLSVQLPDRALWLFTALAPQPREETADRDLRDFIASLGREFRSLSAPISRSTASLRLQLAGDAASRELDTIERCASQVRDLAERMCDASGRAQGSAV